MHLDAATDWHSTLELARRAVQLRDSLAAFATRVEMPPLPEPPGWEDVAALVPILELMQSCSSVLETDTARAAQAASGAGTSPSAFESRG